MGRRMSEKASRPPAEAPTPATKKGGAADALASALAGRAVFRLGGVGGLRFDALCPAPMDCSMPLARRRITCQSGSTAGHSELLRRDFSTGGSCEIKGSSLGVTRAWSLETGFA